MANVSITSDMFETVNTHELRNGDLVSVNGTLFKLRDRQERDLKEGESGWKNGPVVWFRTDVVAIGDPDGMPAHWREDWIIQGNRAAIWQRLDRSKVKA
ncbi:hypothetical protein [Phaeobacter phage MD18]|nr:hypothetical protein [Phaeobacter phage MD18]